MLKNLLSICLSISLVLSLNLTSIADIDKNGEINLFDAKEILSLALGVPKKDGYTEEELLDMAIEYYKRNSTVSNISVMVESSDENTVVLHLFENMSTHTATLDWYTIDKKTAKGTDFMGEAVDLTSVL